MNEPNKKPRFETPEAVAGYAHNRLITILSRLAFERVDEAKGLAAQLTSEMASVGRRAEMTPSAENPERYDLSTLPASSAFDE